VKEWMIFIQILFKEMFLENLTDQFFRIGVKNCAYDDKPKPKLVLFDFLARANLKMII